MGKQVEKYGGDRSKLQFKIYRQAPNGCGPACLRMLEAWATRRPQPAARWLNVDGLTGEGLPRTPMKAALGTIPGLGCRNISANMVETWRAKLPEGPLLTSDSVYLLLTDWYLLDGTNPLHWLILLDRFRGAGRRPLALVANPLQKEREVWPWDQLLASRVLQGFHLTRATLTTK
jgi:hypothetical protein